MAKRKKAIIQEPCIVWENDKSKPIPEIVVYLKKDFMGESMRTNCDVKYVGEIFNDDIISAVVVSGEWEFYQYQSFSGGFRFTLPPGYYPDLSIFIEDFENVGISSFKCINLTNI